MPRVLGPFGLQSVRECSSGFLFGEEKGLKLNFFNGFLLGVMLARLLSFLLTLTAKRRQQIDIAFDIHSITFFYHSLFTSFLFLLVE